MTGGRGISTAMPGLDSQGAKQSRHALDLLARCSHSHVIWSHSLASWLRSL